MDYLTSWKDWLMGTSNPKYQMLKEMSRLKVALERVKGTELDSDRKTRITDLMKNLDDNIDIISQLDLTNPNPKDVELIKQHKINFNSILSESAKLGYLGSL